MKKYNFINKRVLVKKYIQERKTITQIAKEFGCGYGTINRRLRIYNITIRTLSEIQKNRKHKLKYKLIKKFLVKEYIKKRKNMKQIAKCLGCSLSTVRRNLIKFSIRIRPKREALKGKRSGSYIDGRVSKKYNCIDCGKEISMSAGLYGEGRCYSCSNKKRWKNEEYKKKTVKASLLGMHIFPNKPEKQLNKLVNKMFPNEYKYVGDGKVIIGGFCPDFINCNGQKKIIELYGDYWHNKPEKKLRDKVRIVTYKKYGYKTMVIWQHELKNIKRLTNRLINFNNNFIVNRRLSTVHK